MHQHNRMDAELAYWLKKYLIYWGTQSLMNLIAKGSRRLSSLMKAAASQNHIGWMELLHGKLSIDIKAIQKLHCTLSPCHINGSDWMKAMASHLMQASHCQWIFCNFTLHDKQWGYLHFQQRKDLLWELDKLIDMPSDEVPEGSRYLLKLDYSDLYSASFEHQSYWVLAVRVACQASQRAEAHAKASCTLLTSHSKSSSGLITTRSHRYNFTNDDKQMECKLGITLKHNKRTQPNANEMTNSSNKCLQKPDWHKMGPFSLPNSSGCILNLLPIKTEGITICCPKRPCYT